MGLTATTANSVLATAVRAEGPTKGGTQKLGLQGGESTNSLDPALAALGTMQGIESMTVDRDYTAVSLATANADLPCLIADIT